MDKQPWSSPVGWWCYNKWIRGEIEVAFFVWWENGVPFIAKCLTSSSPLIHSIWITESSSQSILNLMRSKGGVGEGGRHHVETFSGEPITNQSSYWTGTRQKNTKRTHAPGSKQHRRSANSNPSPPPLSLSLSLSPFSYITPFLVFFGCWLRRSRSWNHWHPWWIVPDSRSLWLIGYNSPKGKHLGNPPLIFYSSMH